MINAVDAALSQREFYRQLVALHTESQVIETWVIFTESHKIRYRHGISSILCKAHQLPSYRTHSRLEMMHLPRRVGKN